MQGTSDGERKRRKNSDGEEQRNITENDLNTIHITRIMTKGMERK